MIWIYGKFCTKCKVFKSLDEYHKHKGIKDGRNTRCKVCKLAIGRPRYAAYNKKRREGPKRSKETNQKEWLKLKSDPVRYVKHRKTIARYREKNQEKIKLQRKEAYVYNKEYQDKYRKDNRERLNKHGREYRKKQENKDKINKTKRERYKNNICYRIEKNLRNRVNQVVTRKHGRTLEFLGCTIQEFLWYLESLFQEGMNWDNHGSEWHIDHIKPCAIFNLSRESEQKECFHYKNLQPLWAEQNYKKSDNYIEE